MNSIFASPIRSPNTQLLRPQAKVPQWGADPRLQKWPRAPKVIQRYYGHQADLFSIGVILSMLCGCLLFDGQSGIPMVMLASLYIHMRSPGCGCKNRNRVGKYATLVRLHE